MIFVFVIFKQVWQLFIYITSFNDETVLIYLFNCILNYYIFYSKSDKNKNIMISLLILYIHNSLSDLLWHFCSFNMKYINFVVITRNQTLTNQNSIKYSVFNPPDIQLNCVTALNNSSNSNNNNNNTFEYCSPVIPPSPAK